MFNAKILADSINLQSNRITTMKITFPRIVLAEFNTHRMFSRNSASSRAIPFNKMVKMIEENPFIPIAFQCDHKGMQGSSYFTDEKQISEHKFQWLKAKDKAIEVAKNMNHVGNVTKQLVNRLLEPFMWHTVIVTATEWENFFNLRCPSYEWEYEEGTIKAKSKEEFLNMFLKRYPTNGEKDLIDELQLVNEDLNPINPIAWLSINKGQADIHMMFLAEAIYDAMNESIPTQLEAGEWHIPYRDNIDIEQLANIAPNELTGITMAKVSIARCARLSYQTLGDNPVIDYKKDLQLYETLSTSGHWSPFEHVAKVMTKNEYNTYFKGIAKYEPFEGYDLPKKGLGWCRNFKGFIQYRELLD